MFFFPETGVKVRGGLTFEYSNEIEHFDENGIIKNQNESATIFTKVQRTQNQVFVTKGLAKSDTNGLTSIAKTDSDASYENHF